MRKFLTCAFVGALLAIGSAAIVAAPAADPAIGKWKLNVAKSKFGPEPVPKSQVRSYVESAEGLMLTYTNVGTDGKKTAVQVTYKIDGKDYPATGAPDYDTVSLKRIDSNNCEFTLKKGGKVVWTGVRSVSADGKQLTNNFKASSSKSAGYDIKLLFDRQ